MKIINSATTPSTIRISENQIFAPPAAATPVALKIAETY
jgi:hypothetical protein